MPNRLNGLVAAPFTAFHPDGALHLERIDQQAEHLISNGVTGAFVCGTTGEGLSMTVPERRQVAQRWVEVVGGRLKVIVHVGHTALSAARELTAHAQQIGADAVSAMSPCFFKPASADDLTEFCRQVAGAAPRLAFYYYHIPSMTGVSFPMGDFLNRAADRVPTLAGIKFTFENLMDYRQCVTAFNGRYDILFGRDELLLAGLALGARGAVGSTYNYAAPVYHRLMERFQTGDLEGARAEQDQSIRIIDVMIQAGGMSAAKAIMNLVGVDCGPVRSPLRPFTSAQQARLREDLEAVGFFDAIAPRAPRHGSPQAVQAL